MRTPLKLTGDDVNAAVIWFRKREDNRPSACLRRIWRAAKFNGNRAEIPMDVFLAEMKRSKTVTV